MGSRGCAERKRIVSSWVVRSSWGWWLERLSKQVVRELLKCVEQVGVRGEGTSTNRGFELFNILVGASARVWGGLRGKGSSGP